MFAGPPPLCVGESRHVQTLRSGLPHDGGCGVNILERFAVILGAVAGVLILYVALGVQVLLGNGRPSGSGGGGGSAW